MSSEVVRQEQAHIAPTYKRSPITWERGDGLYLYDSEGREYLDMAAGIAVNALGYQHPAIERVLSRPGLIHTSNLYFTRPQIELAQKLCQGSFASRVFFCNSGTEANEGALKFARKWGGARRGIVAFSEGFHGRSMGALSCTANPRYREAFEPLIGQVHFAHYNDLDSVRLDSTIAAVIVEPIQGEGGVRPAQPGFLQGLRRLCDLHQCLLIFDEVQCGLGRTGTLWAYQQEQVEPDILTVAKPLAGGLPMGAILLNQKVAQVLEPGDHGSTFGGGPLVARVAQAVLEVIDQPEFLQQVQQRGQQLEAVLQQLVRNDPRALEVRGRGLMWGLRLDESLPVARLVEAGHAQGLVMLSSGGNTLRLLPPLIIEPQHIQRFSEKIQLALEACRALA